MGAILAALMDGMHSTLHCRKRRKEDEVTWENKRKDRRVGRKAKQEKEKTISTVASPGRRRKEVLGKSPPSGRSGERLNIPI